MSKISAYDFLYGVKSEDLYENKLSLGLNKRAKKTFNDADAIDNVSQINFEDPEVEHICHENGVYTYDDAARVTSINGWFFRNTSMKRFNEFKLFTSVKKIDFDFYECDALQEITLPDSLTSIGDDAFYKCSMLLRINIPNGVTSIGKSAFEKCELLSNIVIPEGVTSIGKHAFSDCSKLMSVTIPDSVKSIGARAFSFCSSLQTIRIPNGVNVIEDNTFCGCYMLKSVVIPDSVECIRDEAFYLCHSLGSVTIPRSVKSIGDGAFVDCYSIKSVDIQYGLAYIGDSAFKECKSLVNITIPDSVTEIESGAFEECRSLKSINIPNSVTSIGDDVFTLFSELKVIYISKDSKVYDKIREQYQDYIKLVDPSEMNEAYDLGLNKRAKKQHGETDAIDNVSQIPFEDKEVERICHEHGVYTYGDAREVTSIEGWFKDTAIESFNELKHFIGLKEIEDYAFFCCRSLKSINIPNSVTSIGLQAFERSKSLQSINIPNGVTCIENYAFYCCDSLKSINIPNGVTSIGDCAFFHCKSLQSISIPDNVKSIGVDAFHYCYSLKTISISKGCPVYSDIKEDYPKIKLVDPSEMNEAHNLGLNKRAKKQHEEVDVVDNMSHIVFEDPEVEMICHGHGVFTYDDARKVTNIDGWFCDHPIRSFNELKHFTSLNAIEGWTFTGCKALKEITIPDSVTSIGSDAFTFCKSLQLVNIPNGVESIGVDAFQGCKSLQSINIPDSVTTIVDPFNECNSLKTIYISKDSPVYSDIEEAYPKIKLVDPSEMNESYDLGLNKRAKKQHEEVDAVENIAAIPFEDSEVARICHEHGVYTYDDAARVPSIIYKNERGLTTSWFSFSHIKRFKEFRWFTGLRELSAFSFDDCKDLEVLHIPESIKVLKQYSLNDCWKLKELVIWSKGLDLIEYNSVSRMCDDTYVYMNKTCPAYREFMNMTQGNNRANLYKHTKIHVLDLSQYKDSQSLDESREMKKGISLGLNKRAKKKHESNDGLDVFEEYVDLGLPSGLKWAKMNVGADFEEDYGDYFSPRDIGNLSNGDVRVPDANEWEDLKRFCTMSFETMENGFKGLRVTSKVDPSKYIFLPPAGFDNYGDEGRDTDGYYMLRNIYGYVFNFVPCMKSVVFKSIPIYDDSKFSVRLVQVPRK